MVKFAMLCKWVKPGIVVQLVEQLAPMTWVQSKPLVPLWSLQLLTVNVRIFPWSSGFCPYSKKVCFVRVNDHSENLRGFNGNVERIMWEYCKINIIVCSMVSMDSVDLKACFCDA